MAEELKQGIQRPDPKEYVPPVSLDGTNQETVPKIESMNQLSYRSMLYENLDGYVNKILEFSKLTATEENVAQVVMNLSKKLEQWLTAGDFALDNINEREFAKTFFEEATRRRGMENKTENWKKIINLMMENME